MGTDPELTSDTPEADALEQQAPAGDVSTEERSEPVTDRGERPEGDVLEQSIPVEETQIVRRSARHDDVDEADWLDQSIEEPVEDERR